MSAAHDKNVTQYFIRHVRSFAIMGAMTMMAIESSAIVRCFQASVRLPTMIAISVRPTVGDTFTPLLRRMPSIASNRHVSSLSLSRLSLHQSAVSQQLPSRHNAQNDAAHRTNRFPSGPFTGQILIPQISSTGAYRRRLRLQIVVNVSHRHQREGGRLRRHCNIRGHFTFID